MAWGRCKYRSKSKRGSYSVPTTQHPGDGEKAAPPSLWASASSSGVWGKLELGSRGDGEGQFS